MPRGNCFICQGFGVLPEDFLKEHFCMKPFVRSPYNYDRRAASLDAALFIDLEKNPSKTVQSQRDEADINVIVRNFGLTGQLPQVKVPPTYSDFSGVFDFQSAMNMIRAAEESFAALPAAVRNKFNNSPDLFVDYCQEVDEDGNLKNIEEMRKMGLAIPKEEPIIVPPMRVEVVNPSTEES